MAGAPATPTPAARQPGEVHCRHCRRYLGRVVGTVFVEPNGDKSALPVVRHCPRCNKRNVRLQ